MCVIMRVHGFAHPLKMKCIVTHTHTHIHTHLLNFSSAAGFVTAHNTSKPQEGQPFRYCVRVCACGCVCVCVNVSVDVLVGVGYGTSNSSYSYTPPFHTTHTHTTLVCAFDLTRQVRR